uniref:Peroxiredoxin-like 2A n=1 Tax=Petromyzon marinus TaxID=7757 RepID=S4RAC9_PETMA
MCREEASLLSALSPFLSEHDVPLAAVVHENVGTEIKDFQPFFQGQVYLDQERRFYGPKERWMFWLGFVRLSVWRNFMRAREGGFQGNMLGEGRILGGVYVIGAGDQGVLLDHKERQFGDIVNKTAVMDAVRKIQPILKKLK